MKYFLVVLLGVLPFFSPAQDVTIPADVARFFLEQHDRAVILTKKDSLNKLEIKSLLVKISTEDSIILSYKRDSVLYKKINDTQEELIKSIKVENAKLTKEKNLQNIKVCILTSTTAGALVGSGIPLIGTIPGTLIGGAVGVVVYAVKSLTRSHR